MSNEHRIAKAGLLLAALTFAGSFIVPEVRQYFGLERPPLTFPKEDQSVSTPASARTSNSATPAAKPPNLKEFGPSAAFRFGAITPNSTADDVLNLYGDRRPSEKSFKGEPYLDYGGAIFYYDATSRRIRGIQIFNLDDAKEFQPYLHKSVDEFIALTGPPSKIDRADSNLSLRYNCQDVMGRRATMSGLFSRTLSEKNAEKSYSVMLDWNPK